MTIKFLGLDAKGTGAAVVAVYEIDGLRVEVDINDTTTIDDYNDRIATQDSAETAASNIPNWASWTESEAESWFTTNIQDPIDSAPTVTSGNVVAVVQGMLTILGYMATMLWALARLTIALRNRTWPNLEGS